MAYASAAAHAQDLTQMWRGDGLAIRIHSGAPGNLAWQLDTLAGHTNTAPADYEALWKTDLRWDAEDARQLQQWSVIYDRYRHRKTRNRKVHSPYPQNYGAFYGDSVAREFAFRIAAFDARDLDELRQSYRKLCGKACADRSMDVLQHFWPRFLLFWRNEGVSTASKIMPALAQRMSDAGMASVYRQEVRIVGMEPAAGTPELVLDMVVHPKNYLTNYTATVMDNHILYEAVDDAEVGGARLPLLIHESMHHFYELANPAEHTRLTERFAARSEPWSMAAYSLLNEALASAFQLLHEKKTRSPEDYQTFAAVDENVYFDPFISKLGRSTAPLVEEFLAAGKSIFDDRFADAYMRAAASALASLKDSPRFLLSTRVVIAARADRPARDEFNRSVRGMVGQEDWADLKASPILSGVALATSDSLPQLRHNHGVLPASLVDEVTAAARTHEAFCFAWRRSPKAVIYIMYGNSEDRLLRTIEKFAAQDTPFIGLRTY